MNMQALFQQINLKMICEINSGPGLCQVCGEYIGFDTNSINCWKHKGTRRNSIALARYCHCLKETTASFDCASIETLASEFEVSPSTVRRYLKLEGYYSIKGWLQKDPVKKRKKRGK